MRIYEVRHLGRTIQFSRAFHHAKNVVRVDDPKAREISNDNWVEYSNGFEIHAIEIKPDKTGILNKLNSLLEQKSSLPEEPEESKSDDTKAVPVWPLPIRVDEELVGIIPAIQYTGSGKGTCLHCNKQVGYVGGFPKVNPPDAIRDQPDI